MNPKFYCETCDEPVYDHSDITIHKVRNVGNHDIVRT